eukprot:TRINITY_DN496_c0_g1_i1.p1 TRINITY_DN496_c0_g1~~TRINITY_DN496_c0_g1_i1.p1  ORF type:complete len:298 (+),score=70.13 TRINITY_DN496_c0_g1_i1:51-896(+)
MANDQLSQNQASAEQCKARGNGLFAKGKFRPAIDEYTEAISLFPTNGIFYSNRALCWMKLNEYDKAIQDCQVSLQHSPQSVKAYYVIGQAHAAQRRWPEAIAPLQKALSMSKDTQVAFSADVGALLRKAKREYWDQQQSEEQEASALILSDYIALLEQAKAHELALQGHDQARRKQVEESYTQRMQAGDRYFTDIATRRKKLTEIPDHFCCKISMELMKDPVVTPSGITYEKEWIMTHLRQVGQFDPTTRQPMSAAQLVPNYALKEAIDHFLDEHPYLVDM